MGSLLTHPGTGLMLHLSLMPHHLLAQEQKARMTAAGKLGRTAAEAFCLGKGSRRAVLDPEPPALGTEINLSFVHTHT